MAISHNKKFLAICERAQQAVCFIYEVNSLKRRRILTSTDSVAKEFIDVKFAYSEDKLTNFLFTLVSATLARSLALAFSQTGRLASSCIDVTD